MEITQDVRERQVKGVQKINKIKEGKPKDRFERIEWILDRVV